ncbi:hypothetical protein HZA97_08230 [Candidatus Woesearchaeota archaeon]|nr:hypothetical protein [Candidatus Woesearchaeota archaeon]
MAEETQVKNGLEKLTEQYGYNANTRTVTNRSFDSATELESSKKNLRRISNSPQTATSTGDVHVQMASIQLDLASLADEYGKLNVNFSTLVGSKKLYGLVEGMRIKGNELIGRKQAAKALKLRAIQRRGDSIEYLVNQMSEVLNQQYQKVIEGGAKCRGVQLENISHMKTLDRKLVESLKSGVYKGVDMAQAEKEVEKLETELNDIQKVLEDYETKINAAKRTGDIDGVSKLADEMSQVLDIKHGVLDGRLGAEGVVSEIRRKILGSAEAVQSAKGATAASKVNYQALELLIGSYHDLEIKYKNAKEDMIPVFLIQGKIAAMGMEVSNLKDLLLRVSNISNQLMKANSDLVTKVSSETFNLLQTPLYDPVKMREAEEKLSAYRAELNRNKIEWAESVQSIKEVPDQAHYAQP